MVTASRRFGQRPSSAIGTVATAVQSAWQTGRGYAPPEDESDQNESDEDEGGIDGGDVDRDSIEQTDVAEAGRVEESAVGAATPENEPAEPGDDCQDKTN